MASVNRRIRRGRLARAMSGLAGAADSCTLSPADLPARIDEFDRMFASSLRQVTVLGPEHARWTFAATASQSKAIHGLLRREQSCCSFFTFEINRSTPGTVIVDVLVPASRSDVLALLNQRAARQASLTSGGRVDRTGLAQ